MKDIGNDQYASYCLKKWGHRNRYDAPRGYPRQSALVIWAKGKDISHPDNGVMDRAIETVSYVVKTYLNGEQRLIVTLYFEPQWDPRNNKNMKEVFSRPTPFILKSLRIRRANKLNLKVAIGFKDVFGNYGSAVEDTLPLKLKAA